MSGRNAPAVATSALYSLVVAGCNLYSLAAGGGGRVRDLRVLRLARRAADQWDWNLLAALPAWVHAERNINDLTDSAVLFVCAAIAAFLILVPVAGIVTFAVRGLKPAATQKLLLALLAIPAAGFAIRLSPIVAVAIAIVLFAVSLPVPERILRRGASLAFLGSGAVVAVAVSAAAYGHSAHAAGHHRSRPGAPNVILISIDSLRADHVHAYGYSRETSPNIDALAASGGMFETVISPTSWTLPSHMTLLTSLAPEKHGVITDRFRLASDADTLSLRFRRAGYATAGFVSAAYLDGLFGFSRGFDIYDDYTILRVAGEKSRVAVTSQLVAGRAVQWMTKHAATDGDRPFFLFLHFFDVHYDYNPPPAYARMFDSSYTGRTKGNVDSLHTGMPARDVDHVVALYDGEIAWVDANVGKVLATLRSLHLDDNTIVAVTADHGEEFLEHGSAGHNKTLYDEVLRVPLVIRYPGHVVPGRKVDGQVRLMDVGPTLLALAGMPLPRTSSPTDAKSLACLVTSATAGECSPLLPAFGDLRGEVASIRIGDAKFIRNLTTNAVEFYDLGRDPEELKNLASIAQPRQKEMGVMLDRWRSSSVENSGDDATLEDEDKTALRSLGYLQ